MVLAVILRIIVVMIRRIKIKIEYIDSSNHGSNDCNNSNCINNVVRVRKVRIAC